jgi:putative transcriptional regulator
MDTRLRTTVRAIRQRLEMQQGDLAKAIGVSRQTLSSIEAGGTVPSTQIALALAQ